jgi:hypothetical protein
MEAVQKGQPFFIKIQLKVKYSLILLLLALILSISINYFSKNILTPYIISKKA